MTGGVRVQFFAPTIESISEAFLLLIKTSRYRCGEFMSVVGIGIEKI